MKVIREDVRILIGYIGVIEYISASLCERSEHTGVTQSVTPSLSCPFSFFCTDLRCSLEKLILSYTIHYHRQLNPTITYWTLHLTSLLLWLLPILNSLPTTLNTFLLLNISVTLSSNTIFTLIKFLIFLSINTNTSTLFLCLSNNIISPLLLVSSAHTINFYIFPFKHFTFIFFYLNYKIFPPKKVHFNPFFINYLHLL